MVDEDGAPTSWATWWRRPDGRVQVGVGPGAWVVDGWSPEDGDQSASSLLVSQLGRAVVRAPTSARRPGVAVVGSGQIARALIGALRPAADDRGRTVRTLDDLRGVPGTDLALVLISPYLVPLGTARHPGVVGRPVLPVIPQTGRVVLGPWTGLPGGPCLHCLDLHRRDRDPAWPSLAASVEDPLTAPLPPRHTAEVIDAVRALAVLLTSTTPQNQAGTAHEIGPDAPHVVARRWTRHQACPWHDQPC